MESLFEGLVILGIVAVSILFAKCAKLVRPDQRMIVERLGMYNRTCGPGWRFIVPFVDKGIILQLNEFAPGWKGFSEEQLCQKLVHDFYQKTIRDVPIQAATRTDAPAPVATNASDPSGWWVHIDGKSHWVPDTATLHSWVSEGRVGRNDLVWDAGTSRWISATKVQELQSQLYPLGAIQTHWRYDLLLAIWPLFVLLIGLFGVIAITGTVSAGLLSALQALSWEKTEGRITQSAVLAEERQYDNGSRFVWYRRDLRYEYWVAKQRYESSRIGLSTMDEDTESRDRTYFDQVVSRYSPGDPVTVYFDPAQANSASLDRGEGMIVGFVLGLIMTGGATLALYLWWRRRFAVDTLRKSAVSGFASGSLPPPPPDRSAGGNR